MIIIIWVTAIGDRLKFAPWRGGREETLRRFT